MERGAEAVTPDVDQQAGATAGTEGVAVDTDDAGDRPAVRVQGRGSVVGFDLEDQAVGVIEGHDPRIVVEHRDQPGSSLAFTNRPVHRFGRALDVGTEERADLLVGPALFLVPDDRVEDLVLAVLAPGLGQAFQFHVGRVRVQACVAAGRVLALTDEIVADRLHLRQREREQAVPAQVGQKCVGSAQLNGFGAGCAVQVDPGDGQVRGRAGPLLVNFQPDGLDHRVGQQFDGDPLGLLPVHAGEQVEPGTVDRRLRAQRSTQRVLDGDQRALAHRVRDAGFVAHGHRHVEAFLLQPPQRAALLHRIDELGEDSLRFAGLQVALDVVDLASANAAERLTQVGANPLRDRLAAWVGLVGAWADLQSRDRLRAGHALRLSKPTSARQPSCVLRRACCDLAASSMRLGLSQGGTGSNLNVLAPSSP